MNIKIKFGTDGWRGIIARDFTFENLRRVAYGVVKFLKPARKSANALKRPVVIGYDRRFLSEKFASEFARVIAGGDGVKTILSSSEVTTPMLSYASKKLNALLGVMITASHNPPEYNGIKFKSSSGASVPPETTTAIEKLIPPSAPTHLIAENNHVESHNLKALYIAKLKKTFSRFIAKTSHIKHPRRRIKIIFDPMHGSGAGGTLKNLLADFHHFEVTEINSEKDPLFGGINPEPIKKNLEFLAKEVRRQNADVGIAIDGDGDRLGVVDNSGRYLSPHTVFPIFLEHLLDNYASEISHNRSGLCAVQGVAMGYLSERISAAYGINLKEVPVGFKYLAEELIANKNCFIGAEESGGIGFGKFIDYIPERDGLAAAMFLVGIISNSSLPLSAIADNIYKKYGKSFYERYDLHIPDTDIPPDKEKIYSEIKKHFTDGGNTSVSLIDGIKIRFPDKNSWLLVRPSGTEPVVRIYSETSAPDKTHRLISKAAHIVSKKLSSNLTPTILPFYA